MPKISRASTDLGKSGRGERPLVQRNTADSAPRLVATAELMGSGDNLALPLLNGVPVEHSLCAGDEPAVALAKTLLKLDIAFPEDWEKARRDPSEYVGITLGLPKAEEKQTNVRLAFAINEIMRSQQLSQAAAARRLDINQPKISALWNYQLQGFSVERLMNFLTALGRDVEIVIRHKSRRSKGGQILVTAA